jgi:hypothetical protein
MKFNSYFLWLAFMALACVSCDPENVIGDSKNVDTDTLDYVWDTTKVVSIALNSNAITTSDAKKVTVQGSVATIVSKGTYKLSGTLNNGQIIVNANGIVRLILNNATIKNSSTSPVFIRDADKAIIILPANTDNTISDGSSYIITADSLNAAIYSKDYLAVYGEGKLSVNASYNTAISSRDELVIQSGNLTINSVGAGLRAKDYLKIHAGTLNVTSGGDALKAENDTLTKGFVEIDGGDITLNSSSDGISATSYLLINAGKFSITSGGGSGATVGEESTKGLKASDITVNGGEFSINSADNSVDGQNNVTIGGGSFTLASSAKALDCDSVITINAGTINITGGEKGISGHHVIFNGGTVNVNTTNDCVKGTLGADLTTSDGSSILVKGGMLFISTVKGDGLDSNGSIDITGGTVVVQGSHNSSDDAVTFKSTFLISGGKLIASGGATLSPQAGSTQKAVYIRFNTAIPAATVLSIRDASGNTVLTYRTAKTAYTVLLSLPALTATTYSVYTGGSVTGTDTNGYFADGVYTPGTLRGSFTISNAITSVTL